MAQPQFEHGLSIEQINDLKRGRPGPPKTHGPKPWRWRSLKQLDLRRFWHHSHKEKRDTSIEQINRLKRRSHS